MLGGEGKTGRHKASGALRSQYCHFAARPCSRDKGTHPEVNLQIPSATEFSIANLKCDSHLIILMQGLVKAFPLMGGHLDVVGKGGGEKAQEGGKERETHDWQQKKWKDLSVGGMVMRRTDYMWREV